MRGGLYFLFSQKSVFLKHPNHHCVAYLQGVAIDKKGKQILAKTHFAFCYEKVVNGISQTKSKQTFLIELELQSRQGMNRSDVLVGI